MTTPKTPKDPTMGDEQRGALQRLRATCVERAASHQAVADRPDTNSRLKDVLEGYAETYESIVEWIDREAALSSPPVEGSGVEEGYVVVPREATEEMLKAGKDAAWATLALARPYAAERACYAAMLAASPSPPVGARKPDVRAICETLGFDPTNHHNAAKCPYCQPDPPVGEDRVKEGD